jgi:hypothetical protein
MGGEMLNRDSRSADGVYVCDSLSSPMLRLFAHFHFDGQRSPHSVPLITVS